MKFNLTLTRRYVLYLAGIIAVLLFSSLFITSTVVRSSFTNLFGQRLTKCRDVLDQYTDLQQLQTLRKLEAVLTSPRFLAAVSTGDSGTIHRETPTYKGILEAEFMIIVSDVGQIVYSSKKMEEAEQETLKPYVLENRHEKHAEFVNLGGTIYELLISEIITNDGYYLGKLIAGSRFSDNTTSDLRNLTGFEVFFSRQGHILAKSESRLTNSLADTPGFFADDALIQKEIRKIELNEEEIMYLALPSSYANATVTFAGSLDESIAPIMSQVKLFLMTLTVIGGLAALFAIYVFTKRRIGRQVDLLVAAADHIAAGDMDFELKSFSNDEFGYLVREFEEMRSRLMTGRKELEKAHEQRLASERLATTGKFVAGIIHDLKNPLAVIRSSTELMQFKGPSDEKVIRHCQNINKQIDRMVDLTRDVLDFCRGKIRLELKQCHLKDFFKEVREFHDPSFKKAGILLNCSGIETVFVNLDASRFRRVIDNLLNNAREALKPGDEVTIKWVIDRDKLEISVSDNGPGIPEEIRDTLFEPFVTSGKENGTGLGLAVAKKIIEDHGATVEVESETNVGTTFRIALPIQLVETAKPDMTAVI
jgi:signal transduction histidine kinase